MARSSMRLAIAGAALFSTVLTAAAQSPITFVSEGGTDAGNCASVATACRTLQFAFGKTNSSGEIRAVNPANYFFITINKPITITGVPGASIIRGTAGEAVTVNVPAPAPANFVNDVVTISDFIIDGVAGAATNGILVNQAGHLTIKNCLIKEFSNAAINLISTRNLRFLIEDTVVANNGSEAIRVRSPTLTSRGSLVRVSSVNNGFAGMRTFNGANVNVVDSVFSGNQSDNILMGAATGTDVGGDVSVSRSSFLGGGSGIRVLAGSNLRIENSSITGNNKGLDLSNNAAIVVRSAGNNFIIGNTTDVQGPGTVDITGGQK